MCPCSCIVQYVYSVAVCCLLSAMTDWLGTTIRTSWWDMRLPMPSRATGCVQRAEATILVVSLRSTTLFSFSQEVVVQQPVPYTLAMLLHALPTRYGSNEFEYKRIYIYFFININSVIFVPLKQTCSCCIETGRDDSHNHFRMNQYNQQVRAPRVCCRINLFTWIDEDILLTRFF